jgi:cell division protein FtsL
MNRVYIQSKQLKQQQPLREKDPVHFRSLMLILLTASLVVLGILSYIWRGVEILTMGYKMRAIYSQQTVLQEQRQKLLLEKAALRSLDRIEDLASRQLNLVKPNPDQVVILSRSSNPKSIEPDHEQ